MLYLITRQRNKKFEVYLPAIYGCETWGDGSYQASIEQKRKFWYITTWRNGGEYSDDINNSYKLNVVHKTESLQEVTKFLHEAKVSKEEFNRILDSIHEQITDFIAFEKWCYTPKKN